MNAVPQVPATAAAFAPGAVGKKRSWFGRHKILTALGAFILLIFAISVANGGGGGTTAKAPDQPVAAEPSAIETTQAVDEPLVEETPVAPVATVPGIGVPVRDGKFEFTVTGLEPGVARIGGDAFGIDAQGQFLLVHLTVTNIGDEAQYFDGSSQKLTDTLGRTHSADASAAMYLDDSNSFLNQINPGNSVDGVVVFDIPADAVPASIELHDSIFSGGVTVGLK